MDSTERLARWRLGLSKLEFDIDHRAGVKRQAADALSGLKKIVIDGTLFKENLPFLAIDAKSEKSNALVTSLNSDYIILLAAQEEKTIDTHHQH